MKFENYINDNLDSDSDDDETKSDTGHDNDEYDE